MILSPSPTTTLSTRAKNTSLSTSFSPGTPASSPSSTPRLETIQYSLYRHSRYCLSSFSLFHRFQLHGYSARLCFQPTVYFGEIPLSLFACPVN
jgi:hypothetical protein